MRQVFGGLLLASVAPACAVATVPPPVVAPASAEALVAGNADAARLLAALTAAGLRPVAGDVSAVDNLAGAPGYVWRLGAGWLHLHVYPSQAKAAAAAAGFAEANSNRKAIVDWVAPPHLYHCGTAVALYLGEDARALAALTSQCGAEKNL